ncbi:16S rRNA (cytosine(1402)-N(4))-methyltransferase RsmH [bacterium]|nr:16S rRNA (cytosine(1402)-N(4))-methyltransferase RsmH [bacterium]
MDYRSPYHNPVLVAEVLELLAPRSAGLYLDCTAGGGGHSRALLEASAPEGRVCALDRDPEAVEAVRARLAAFAGRLSLACANFEQAPAAFPGLRFDGILLDLGVSSHQLDEAGRGFSCDKDGPLDMRMSGRGESAAALVNSADEAELDRLFARYGETRFHRNIARAVVRARADRYIDSTAMLADTVRRAVPVLQERKSVVQVFQALRIAVNDELGALERGLPALFETLAERGRLAVIAYHSLEDRLVKHFFRGLENPCVCPPGLPVCACGRKSRARVLTAHPVGPAADELEANPRSRSARLRAAERLAA